MSTSVTVTGQELIDERRFIDTCEASWLAKLALFDDTGAWAEDGHATCVGWLVERCGLGRSTAMEKLRVAHELTRRPVISDAFAAGTVPYSKVRVLTRLEGGVDDARDAEFLAHAAGDTAEVLERRVQRHNYYSDQDKKPTDLNDRRGIRRMHGFAGEMGRLVVDAPDDDIDRVLGLLDAYLNYLFHHRDHTPDALMPVDESPMETHPQPLRPVARTEGFVALSPEEFAARFETVVTDETSAEPPRTLPQRRLDALLDLMEEIALVRDDRIDPETAAVAVTVDYETLVERAPGSATLASGRIVSGDAARRLACDAGICRIITAGVSEVLDVGRKTRTWNPAQRRVIRARHNHRCAFPGCDRRITQIHHIIFWDYDGKTAIINGTPACSTHHHLLHEGGWTVTWNPATGITRFQGPRGQVVESTSRLRHAA